ncbi:MAG: hypothetical protein IT367_04475 [Candidatus Hydrogenedentes bacterium]|nr:hypothetical protein [Candidatus Hydrogenedentota bacterium]
MTRLRFLFSLPVLIGAAVAYADAPPLPDADAFSQCVLKIAASYPTNGTNTYYWPKQGEWKGVTRDVTYNGQVVATGDPQGRCHCSGITWEVFMRAVEEYNATHDTKALHTWTSDEVNDFQFKWFGSDGNKKCIYNAVLTFSVGEAVKNRDDARPGDFVQFWRGNGSGHSCIFQDWVRDEKGNITHLKYWSAQKKTNGISFNTETVGDPKGIILEQVYIVRIGKQSGANSQKN